LEIDANITSFEDILFHWNQSEYCVFSLNIH